MSPENICVMLNQIKCYCLAILLRKRKQTISQTQQSRWP